MADSFLKSIHKKITEAYFLFAKAFANDTQNAPGHGN